MNCPTCQRELPEGAAFCPSCGCDLRGAASGCPNPGTGATPAAAPGPDEKPAAAPQPPFPTPMPEPGPQQTRVQGAPPVPDGFAVGPESGTFASGAAQPARNGRRVGPIVGTVVAVVLIAAIGLPFLFGFLPSLKAGSGRLADGPLITPVDEPEAPTSSEPETPESSEPDLPASSEDSAAGRWYACWSYNGTVTTYLFELYDDGTGGFKLGMYKTGTSFTEDSVIEEESSDLSWTQDKSNVVVTDTSGYDYLIEGPNEYELYGEAGHRMLVPSVDDQYPYQTFYESLDEAIANMIVD